MLKNARLIAERYAQALSGAVRDPEELGRVRADLVGLAHVVDQAPELRRALANPVIEAKSKLGVLDAIARKGNARPVTLRFLEVLAAHDRLTIFREVVDAVARVLDAQAGVVEVEIRSAAPLDEALRLRLAAALEKKAGRKIRTREVVDPEILGGLVVTIGGTVFDGSVRTKLVGLRSKLTGEAVGA